MPSRTAERGDPAIEPMVRRIVEQWQADGSGLTPGDKLVDPGDKLIDMDWLRLHDGIARQARYVTRTLFLPGPEYVASIPLPRHFGFAYIPIKLAHDLMALPLWKRFGDAATVGVSAVCVRGLRGRSCRHPGFR